MTARNKLSSSLFLTDPDFCNSRYVLLIIPLHINRLELGMTGKRLRTSHGKTSALIR